jgi:hypothetical protein
LWDRTCHVGPVEPLLEALRFAVPFQHPDIGRSRRQSFPASSPARHRSIIERLGKAPRNRGHSSRMVAWLAGEPGDGQSQFVAPCSIAGPAYNRSQDVPHSGWCSFPPVAFRLPPHWR